MQPQTRFSSHTVLSLLLATWAVASIGSSAILVWHSDVWATPDASYYMAKARDLTNGVWLYDRLINFHIVLYTGIDSPAFDYWRPLLSLLVAAVSYVTGDVEKSARLVVFLIGSVLIPVAVGLVLRSAKAPWMLTLICVVLFLADKQFEVYRIRLETVLPAALFLLLSIALFIRGIQHSASSLHQLGAGVRLGLLAATRGDALAVALTLVIVASFQTWRTLRTPRLLTTLAGLTIGFSVSWVKDLVQFGFPLPPGPSRSAFITHPFQIWHYGVEATVADAGLLNLALLRAHGLKHCLYSIQMWPLSLLFLGVSALVLMIDWRQRDKRQFELSIAEQSLLLFGIASYAAHAAVSIIVVPMNTEWFGKGPVAYLVPALPAGLLALAKIRAAIATNGCHLPWLVAASCLFIPHLYPNPFRPLNSVPEQYRPEFAEAASLVPIANGIVMTDAPGSVRQVAHI